MEVRYAYEESRVTAGRWCIYYFSKDGRKNFADSVDSEKSAIEWLLWKGKQMAKENEQASERYQVVEKCIGDRVWLDIVDNETKVTVYCTSIGKGESGRQIAEKVVENKLKELRENLNSLPGLYIDMDDVDVGLVTERTIWYVMREELNGGTYSVMNSYVRSECEDFIAERILAGTARHALRPYSLSIKESGEEKVYQVSGLGLLANFPRTEEGMERARTLMDTMNEHYELEREGKVGKIEEVKQDKPKTSIPVVYTPPKPKPVLEKSLNWLHNHMKGSDKENPYGLLFSLCAIPEKQLTDYLIVQCGMSDLASTNKMLRDGGLLFKKGKDPKRKDGKRVLAVAHRDTVITPGTGPQYVTYWEKAGKSDNPLDDVLISSCFDDRVGVFTILFMLPRLGIDVDILFTTDEEIGQSTASHFTLETAKALTGYTGEGSPYSHIVEFDRRMEDVVAYDYEDKSPSWQALEKEIHSAGMIIGQGSFTDIGCLTHLLAKAINVGTGVRDEHAVKSSLDVREYLSNLCRYAKLYNTILSKSLSFPHEDKGRKYRGVTTYYGGSEHWDNGEWDREQEEKKRKEREEAWLREVNNAKANIVALLHLPKKHFTNYPASTKGLDFIGSWNLYHDKGTDTFYLHRAKDDTLFIVEEGDINAK